MNAVVGMTGTSSSGKIQSTGTGQIDRNQTGSSNESEAGGSGTSGGGGTGGSGGQGGWDRESGNNSVSDENNGEEDPSEEDEEEVEEDVESDEEVADGQDVAATDQEEGVDNQEEVVVDNDNGDGLFVGGSDDEEDGVVGDVVTDVASVVGPVNIGAPAPPQGNWLTYDELMNDTYPNKSKVVYLSAFKNFEQFLKNSDRFEPGVMPTEVQILNYFHYLKSVKFYTPTSIWSIYSRLNAVFKRKLRFSLKTFPSVTDLLKSFEVGHRVKKSSVFTPQQVFS